MARVNPLMAGMLLAACACGFAAQAEALKFHTMMSGQSEVPPKDTHGAGMVEATLDTATKMLTYKATWQDLTGTATMAHFHGPAAMGANSGVVVPWGNNPPTPFNGTATLTDAQIADLKAGKWYANVHTAKNPAGEIRGQMLPE